MRRLAYMAALLIAAAPALADWNIGDPHKMHYPQLPDPSGWDIDITTDFVYDDWRCSETGPVTDLHFWGSWKGDQVGQITGVIAEIWTDVPAGADPFVPYSHPGEKVWSREFGAGQFMIRGPYSGLQDWYSPEPPDNPTILPNDHNRYYQINIEDIVAPFEQALGTTYWLGLHTRLAGTGPMFGWKTSLQHWNDDAAFRYFDGSNPTGWHELRDPFMPAVSLDMAFVITPEPVGLLLMAAGLLVVLRR